VSTASCCRAHSTGNGFQYQRRKLEDSVLHRVIRENLETFLAQAEQSEEGRGFPALLKKS
jgi:hypothetical protein